MQISFSGAFCRTTFRKYSARPKTSVNICGATQGPSPRLKDTALSCAALDIEASRAAFEELAKDIETQVADGMSLDEVAWGFVKVANETMSRPIRALTEARGYAAQKHILAAFGGAAGQHACSLAKTLGIKTVLVHRFSSILSAYGMSLSDR